MHIEIGRTRERRQLLMRVESEGRRDLQHTGCLQAPGHLLVFAGLGAAPREDQVNPVGMAAVAHRLQERVLRFLGSHPPDAQDIHGGSGLHGRSPDRLRGKVDAVGNHVQARLEAMLRQIIPHDGRRALDVRTMVEHQPPPVVPQEGIDEIAFGEAQVGQDVLRIEVEGRGEGLAHLPRHRHDHVLQRHRLLDMHNIRPFQRLPDDVPLDLGVGKPVGIDNRLKHRELEMSQRKLRLRTGGIRIAHRHQTGIHPVLPQLPDGIVDGNAQAVSGIICIVADKQYFHQLTSNEPQRYTILPKSENILYFLRKLLKKLGDIEIIPIFAVKTYRK